MALFIYSFNNVIEHTSLQPNLVATGLRFPGLGGALRGASVMQSFGEELPSGVGWCALQTQRGPQSLPVLESPSWGQLLPRKV